jgi:hypothetical protein
VIPGRGSEGYQVLKDKEKVVEHKVGLALENLSQRQQSAVTPLQQLHTEGQQSGKLFNDQGAQY